MVRRFSLLLFTCLSIGWSLAQTQQTGVIEGVVRDEQGQTLPAVTIRSAMADGAYAKTVFTSSEGLFRIGFLKPGAYDLQATADGFRTTQMKAVSVHSTQVTRVEIVLPVSSVGETLVVTAQTGLIERGTNDLGTTLSSDDTDLLPVTRTATDLLEFTPGSRPGQLWGGSTDQANNYQLDGVTVNSPGFGGAFLLPNVSWIEEFQVKGLGAGAEFGNFQGGLVNIVTKSGSNTFKGNMNLMFESDSLNGSNLVVGEEGDQVAAFNEVNADVSGALIEDRLYYFVSIEQQRRELDIVDFDNSLDAINFLNEQEVRTETKLFSKMTWQATPNDTLNLVLGSDDVETKYNGLSSRTRPEATTTQDSPAFFYNLSWEKQFGDGTYLLETKLTGYEASNDTLPRNGDIAAVQILGGRRELGRNAPYTRTRDLDSTALTVNLDIFGVLGKTTHNLKVGADYTQGGWDERRRRNGGFTWRPREGEGFSFNVPTTWERISSDWSGDINLVADTLNGSFYVQDYMMLNDHLDLSVGLRYGFWKGELTPGDGSGAQFTALDDSALAPRLGLTYDIKGDGKWVAKAHWGRYYQNMFALLFDRVEGANAFEDVEYWDWNGDTPPSLAANYDRGNIEENFVFDDSDPTSELNGQVENYAQPHVDQLVLSLEHQLGDNWKLGLTWFERENKDVLALVDLNQANNYTAFRDVAVYDFASGDPIQGPEGGNLILPTLWVSNDDILFLGEAPGLTSEQIDALDWDPNYRLMNVDEASRETDQLQLTLDGRGEGWSLGLSITNSDQVGNFYSVSGYDNPSGTGAGAFVLPNERSNFYGRMPNHSEWETKLRATFDLPYDFRLGTFIRWDSGDFYTPSYQIDRRNHDFFANGDTDFLDPDLIFGISGQNVFLEPRGKREYDDFTRLDLSIDKVFRFSAGSRLLIGADAFNLTNEDAAVDVNTLVNDQDASDPVTLFGAVQRRQAPRQIRLFSSFRW